MTINTINMIVIVLLVLLISNANAILTPNLQVSIILSDHHSLICIYVYIFIFVCLCLCSIA
jgi:hypothetical protein